MPVLALIIYGFRLSLPAVWVGICLEWVIRSRLGAKYFARGNWERIELH
jgi:Na+-driven multidrug efflux pump